MKSIGFIDLLFNMLLGTVFMFVIAFIQIAPDAKKQSIEPKAEFVIIVSWPNDINNDVDTWLKDPNGEMIWFRQKRSNTAHLDNDDIGNVNDAGIYNQEVTTIRSIVAGEWIINIHNYKMRDPYPTPVEITIDQLNPSFERILRKTIVLTSTWQEATVCRLEMTESGDILSISDLPAQLVKSDSNHLSRGDN